MKHIDDDDRTWFFDPSFSYDFTEAGTYYLKVSLYNDLALAQGDSYTLQVSLDPAPVPEPTTILLFGTGLAGLAGSRIRRKKKV
ncbi:MAG: PEP-CTERM sorting domain-containing protein [Desulfobulbaceae bacterium]|uniref:PEP-CTERM sorting domain-containing protein n=1 Tax=Candidatus Desulfobia pelagia TaxID=2841692 RepID=A0A8J6NDJ2_9BACT|nr:PEP-CTERM sorting domain-containing protein [Candidatus Desulfobia pelagia]